MSRLHVTIDSDIRSLIRGTSGKYKMNLTIAGDSNPLMYIEIHWPRGQKEPTINIVDLREEKKD